MSWQILGAAELKQPLHTGCKGSQSVFAPRYRLSVPFTLILAVDGGALVLPAVASRAVGADHLGGRAVPRRASGHPIRRFATQDRGRY